jgi:hypothetical protein
VPKPSDKNLAIVALIAFAFWTLVCLPIYYGHSNASHKCSAEESKNHGFWEKADCDPVAYFTLWLVGFTGVLAASTIGLWVVTWRGASNQSKDTRILQRAYIAVEPRGVRLRIEGKRVMGQIGMRNAGNLPARNLSWFVDLKQSNNHLETDFPLKETKGNIVVAPRVVAPRGTAASLNIHDLDGLANSQKREDRAQEHSLFLYVWGAVSYDDGFGNVRKTVFCHRYNWKVRGAGGVMDHEIHEDYARYHEHGNDAT